MARIEWMMKGNYIKNCNCASGCPCDFWEKPTYNICEGMCGMEIDQGYFGDVSLSGLRWVALYHWPGPLHEGNGTLLPIVDERATDTQRTALLTILSGQAGNPWFEVLASVVSKVLQPVFKPIEFECDVEARTAKCSVEGMMETVTEPIKNAVSGEEHRIRVDLPNGMEYFKPEIARTTINKAEGELSYDCANAHSSLAYVVHTQDGLLA